MSYILDALKKMEHEKARKANPAGMTKISGDLFSEDRPRSVQSGVWRLLAVAVVASLVAIAATWFFLAPSRKNVHVASRAVVSPEQDMPPVPRALPVAPPVAPQTPVQPVVQAHPQPAPLSPPPQDVQGQSQAGQSPGAKPFKAFSRRELARQRKETKGPVTEQTAPVAMVASPSDIKVDGIAWQDDRKARRAVINGLLLKEGSIVSGGARVSEIRKDRVRFSLSGRNFEVAMTAPGSPGTAPGSVPSPAPGAAPNFAPAPGNGIGR